MMSNPHRVSQNQRRQMIAEAAYFRAERRGFDGGDPVHDWMEAEAEVDARLREIEHEHLLQRLDETVAAAGKRVTALRKKMNALTANARAEMSDEIAKLHALREAVRGRARDLRERGAEAQQKLGSQAEKLRDELAQTLQRLGKRSRN